MSASVATPPDILRPRVQEGWRQGLLMALAAHGLLAVGLMLHMSWKTQPQDVVEAEVWAEVPVAAQPAARVETAPVVTPPPAPEPAPEPAPAPAPPPPAPAPTPAPPPKPADIQVERKPEPEKKKPVKEVFEPDPPQLKKKLEEARKKPEPVKEPVKEQVKPPPKEVVKPAKEPLREPAREPAKDATKATKTDPGPSSAQLERERQARLKSLMADLGGEGTPSAGPSAAYAGRIKARIKPNIVFTDEVAGNPLATVEVRCAPDGRIIGRRLITRSGHTTWDDAVLRAVDRTEVLPLDERGKVPPVMQIDFRPRDF